MGGVVSQLQQPHGEGLGMNPYLPQRLPQADATAGHLWKDTRNRESRGRDRSPKHYSSRDYRSHSRSSDRHHSRSRDRNRSRSSRRRRSRYRSRSRSRDRRRSRSSGRRRSNYRSRSRSRDRRRSRSSGRRRSTYRRRSRSRYRRHSTSRDRRRSRSSYRRRSRSSEEDRRHRRSRSPSRRDDSRRGKYSSHQDMRGFGYPFPRSLTIHPTLLPRQVMVPGMGAGPLVPPAQGGTLGNNTGGGSSVGAVPLLPQASGGAFGNNTGGGPSVGAVPLLPQASGGGGAGNNTGGGSGTEEEPSAPLGSLLKRMGCLNCGQTGHTKEQCTQGCRKCGSNGHKVEGCVSRNVCPCADWPGHVRWKCHLACLHCKDKRNYDGHRAMRCKRRCAVCGSWKHPSDDCRVQCDCARGGGYHLGQVHIDEDVDCGVCGRFYCPRHCRNCGGDFHSEASCGATVVEERIPNERKRVLQCPLQDHPTFKFGKRCAECDLEKQQRNDAATETEGETKVGFIKAESDGY
jgi:hypothetical protein